MLIVKSMYGRLPYWSFSFTKPLLDFLSFFLSFMTQVHYGPAGTELDKGHEGEEEGEKVK